MAEIEHQQAEMEVISIDALMALLPGPYYMDPPDGGNVTVLEQLQRMAEDAARYRWLRNGHQKGAVRKTRRPDDAPYVFNPKRSVLYGVVAYSGDGLDDAIDDDRLNDLAQHIYQEAQIEGDARFADPAFKFSDEFAEECLSKASASLSTRIGA